ncbi:HEPN domain-containing protein [Candidatus Bathyarchaeota archaeon]|nr:HEPN domain-containing protein [Candidatus Bathyarchaeota archaeon]MBS7627716.1 HEPN domain-containing protein [Candidatus Bathyarchaeota archaeon]
MARSYLRQAEERVKHAEEALRTSNYAYIIRQSQEAVELALKGILRLVAIEPPKWHDVGPILKRHREAFPPWFKGEIDELASISRRLRREREPSMYGDEETGTPPDQLYSLMDAKEALEYAQRVLSLCKKLLKECEQ